MKVKLRLYFLYDTKQQEMWRKRIPSFESLSSVISHPLSSETLPTRKASSSSETIKPQDEVTVLSDLQNENKMLREQLSNAYNQISWLESHYIKNSTQDGTDPPPALLVDSNPSDDTQMEAILNNQPTALIVKMTLTRDVGTMIDPNIFLIEEIDSVEDHRAENLRSNGLNITGQKETANPMTYESRYYQQKILNQILDQRIQYLDDKCQALEEKLTQFQSTKVENTMLKLQQRESNRLKQAHQQSTEQYEKLLYQLRFQNQAIKENLNEEVKRSKDLEEVTNKLKEEMKELEVMLENTVQENQRLLQEIAFWKDRTILDEKKVNQSRYLESKCDSQAKEILRLQMQLELSQSRLSFTPILLQSPLHLHVPDKGLTESSHHTNRIDASFHNKESEQTPFEHSTHGKLHCDDVTAIATNKYELSLPLNNQPPLSFTACFCAPAELEDTFPSY